MVDVASVAIAVVVVVVPIVYPVSLSSSSSSSSPSRYINEAISVRQVMCRSSNLIIIISEPGKFQVFRKFGLILSCRILIFPDRTCSLPDITYIIPYSPYIPSSCTIGVRRLNFQHPPSKHLYLPRVYIVSQSQTTTTTSLYRLRQVQSLFPPSE